MISDQAVLQASTDPGKTNINLELATPANARV